MQDRSQDAVGCSLIGQLSLVFELLEPLLKYLDGMSNGCGYCHFRFLDTYD